MRRLLIVLFCFLAIACNNDGEEPQPVAPAPGGGGGGGNGGGGGSSGDPFTYVPTESLKDIASYPVGMIVSASKLGGTSSSNLTFKEILEDDYNSITAENDMKMANIFRGPGNYDFSDGDAIVAYAKANGMRVHGHTLVWHSSIPGWLNSFSGTDEEFTQLIEDYVKATVAHFAEEKMMVNGEEVSVVAGWDVVNEVFEGNDLRNTLFLQRMGYDYVSKLYTWAREADPDVKLFYNDYNVASNESKRNAIITMVRDFQTDGVPIDGIGFQMHINHDWPPRADIAEAVQEATATGLLIHFSELDIRVNYNDDISELTEERAASQEAKYKEVAEEYANVPANQQYGITIWGMRDQDSWMYDGGTEWPLMYDNDFDYKIAHRGFAEGL
ncbi:endo-1,4-beta-xylanase [Roseivirga sp. BDSF3-8]|uniref:endo-1,4-beta-xylanase n=1 Tax=Roseivirga sp. BDSF3-8 TaxID=3241598 RepID=UPI00353279A7